MMELNSDIANRLALALVYFTKQILYCHKHEFDTEATGGHLKDGGFYAKTARLYFNRYMKTSFRHVTIAQLIPS